MQVILEALPFGFTAFVCACITLYSKRILSKPSLEDKEKQNIAEDDDLPQVQRDISINRRVHYEDESVERNRPSMERQRVVPNP